MSFILATAEQLTREIDEIIEEISPDAGRRSMYGGIVFESVAGNPKTMVCGHFTYKNHVSLEFSNGYQLCDPEKVLEGKGKYRRHIKLTSQSDIGDKFVRSMIEQAFS
ncbi:MAG: DUF1801 domain-containing protein [Woeseiaceae bacterium]